MKTIVAALIALTAFATPAFAVDPTISANCRVGADEAYSRANGFCEQVASNQSLAYTNYTPDAPAEEVPETP